MSWCDKLASTPSVGVKFDHHFGPSSDILDVLTPILDPLVEGDKPKFNITRQDPFAIEFSTQEGFHYGVDPSRVWIEFQHRLRLKPTSGGPPVAELLSRPAPFSELLPDVSKRLLDVSELLLKINPRKLMRVGVVASTSVAQDELPPGISRFIKYIGRPWHGLLDQYTIQVTADLDKQDDWFDRCSHVVIKPDDPEQLLSLRFDWHRTFVTGHEATRESLKVAMDRAADASIKYFEELAEGSRFDEELIHGGAT